jgi:hypothetical protein
MVSIARKPSQNLERPFTSYDYALRVTPGDMEKMSRDELLQLAIEQYYLLITIISIVRNVRAGFSTRLMQVEILVRQVEANVSGRIKSVCESIPALIEGNRETGSYGVGLAESLGLSRNAASSAVDAIVEVGLIERGYRRKDGKQHLQIGINHTFFSHPGLVCDKKEQRTDPKPNPLVLPHDEIASSAGELSHDEKTAMQVPAACEVCGESSDLYVQQVLLCSCGMVQTLSVMPAAVAGGAEKHHDEKVSPLAWPHDVPSASPGDLSHDEKALSAEDAQLGRDLWNYLERCRKAEFFLHIPAPLNRYISRRGYHEVMLMRLQSPLEDEREWAREEIGKRIAGDYEVKKGWHSWR